MKCIILVRDTDNVIGTVITNHFLSLDEGMRLIGYQWVGEENSNNSGYLVGGEYYKEEDLDMDYIS